MRRTREFAWTLFTLLFLSQFLMEGVKKKTVKKADRLGWPPVFFVTPSLFIFLFQYLQFFLLRFGKAPSTEANRKHKILSLSLTQR